MQTIKPLVSCELHRGSVSHALVRTGGSWHWLFGLARISVWAQRLGDLLGRSPPEQSQRSHRGVTEESQEV